MIHGNRPEQLMMIFVMLTNIGVLVEMLKVAEQELIFNQIFNIFFSSFQFPLD